VLTNLPVSPATLQLALNFAANRSFNSISVDGEMSTNDMIIIMANGAGGTKTDVIELDHINPSHSKSYAIFRNVLTEFMIDLAKLVVWDGEGATRFVGVSIKVSFCSHQSPMFLTFNLFVQGALTYTDAHLITSQISTSALVKTVLYSEDAK
jgi:glutamate N-acetyltransferase / amino-acid N-acetyltransferase